MIQGPGDLAHMLFLRRSNVGLRQQIDTLNVELVTGRKADPLTHLSGNLSPLAGIERDLTLHAAWRTSRATASAFAAAQQSVLGRMQTAVAGSATSFLDAGNGGAAVDKQQILVVAAQDFQALASALNTTYAGRAIFAGTATGGAALAPAEDILAALGTAVAGADTAADILAAAEDFFLTPGGGFDTAAYRGGEPLAAFTVDAVEAVEVSVTAGDDEVREALLPLAIAHLMADGLLADDPAERGALFGALGERMLDSNTTLVGLQGELGVVEARIEQAEVRAAATESSLELARNDLIGVDEYEVASKLEQTAAKLETVYVLTNRLAGLSLARFLT